MNPDQNHQLIVGLPGAQRVLEGLEDHRHQRHTLASCLVRIAHPRLARAGMMQPVELHDTHAELELYQLLASEGNQAHSRYNALIRELVSFERALDHRMTKANSKS